MKAVFDLHAFNGESTMATQRNHSPIHRLTTRGGSRIPCSNCQHEGLLFEHEYALLS